MASSDRAHLDFPTIDHSDRLLPVDLRQSSPTPVQVLISTRGRRSPFWHFITATLAACLLGATTLRASVGFEHDACVRPPKALVAELVDWIRAATQYDVSRTRADPPVILFCDEGDTLDYAGGTTLIEPGEGGVYDYAARVIYIVAPWDPEDTWQRSILLHEIVHDVQFLNRSWPCPNATEIEAYELQDAWLLENGVQHDFNWLAIWFWAQCPGGPHP